MKSEIIVEIGQNHDGYISKAKELIYAAKENGGDVAKFQLLMQKNYSKEKTINGLIIIVNVNYHSSNYMKLKKHVTK